MTSAIAVDQHTLGRRPRAIGELTLLLVLGACSGATDAPSLSAIHVQPLSVGLIVQAQTTLHATPVDAAGHILTGRHIFWSSEDANIATVSAGGVVTAETPGRVNIAASADGVTGVAVITVSALTVASVIIVPESLALAPNASAHLQATAYDAAGRAVTGLPATWGSSDQSVATVDSTGNVTGIGPGRAAATVAMAGRLASASVIVTTPAEVDVAGCNGGTLDRTVPGDLVVTGDIDGQCSATLRSTSGSIEIRGKIDHASSATLMAATSVSIGDQIDGGSQVQITAGAAVSVANDVTGSSGATASTLTVWNSSSLTVGGDMHGGVQAKLHSHGSISVGGHLSDQDTVVLWWAPSFIASGGINGGAQVIKQNWGGFPDSY